MAVCFQMYLIGQKEPLHMGAIDAAMCWHFRVECQERRWYNDWYEIVGYLLASGRTFQQTREELARRALESTIPDSGAYYNRLIEIVDWMETRFTVNHWSEWGRRKD